MKSTRAHGLARLARIRANPDLNAAYLARKRRERKARGLNNEVERKRKARWRKMNAERNVEHRGAHRAIAGAIRTGKMIRPAACQQCGGGGKIQAHHHKGYAKQYWLDVQWLCTVCHTAADRATMFQGLENGQEKSGGK